MRHELAHESVVILEGDYSLVFVTRSGLGEFDALFYESLDPESNRAREYRERNDGDLAATLSSAACIRPREKRENSAWISVFVAEVEVVCGWIVEVDGALDQSEAECASIEVEIPLGVTGDAGDVVDTGSA
jgi:hypothetical protein